MQKMKILKNRDHRTLNRSLRLERWYRTRLKQVAEIVNLIIRNNWNPADPSGSIDRISDALKTYGGELGSWSRLIAREFLGKAAENDWSTWREISHLLSGAERREIETLESDPTFQEMIDLEAELITSLPLEAAARAQEIARQSMYDAYRFEHIIDSINVLGDITEGRATLIARTESSRARTEFTRLRAEKIQSPGFIWRTVGDGTVRPMHQRLNGKYFDWDDPPICDYQRGEPRRALPGCIWNCHCYALPVIPKTQYEIDDET